MSEADERRKIIEIYVTENKKEKSILINLEKTENTKIADCIKKMLTYCFLKYDEIEY